MSLTTNSPVTVYVKFTDNSQNHDIEYYTDYNATSQWQPEAIPANSQTKYTFEKAKGTDNFGWYGLTFWPVGSSGIETGVVENFQFPSTNQKTEYLGVTVDKINLSGGNTTPNFCVCNDGTGSVESVGVELTLSDQKRPTSRYFTSRDPEIPLTKEGTGN